MKAYVSYPESFGHGGRVVVREGGDERELDPRLDLRNHSPTGFAWGYAGSGPAQLALAILCDATGDDALAERHYMAFKDEVVSGLDDRWQLTRAAVFEWLVPHFRTQAQIGLREVAITMLGIGPSNCDACELNEWCDRCEERFQQSVSDYHRENGLRPVQEATR